MNLLFVNYGDFTTNSLNHIAGFTQALSALGHACVVAVPKGRETLSAIAQPLFIPATYDEVLARPRLFPDGRGADLIHAWTPRECVRKFVLDYQRRVPTRLVVHLEDNEEFLMSAYSGRSLEELRTLDAAEQKRLLAEALSHPLRYRNVLRLADGVTVITDSLRDFVPSLIRTELLPPGVDFSFYKPQPADPALRTELGLRPDEKVIVFTGSNTFANEPEMRELYLAVQLLNERGTPTRLVRTGFNSPQFKASLAFDWEKVVVDLGFVEKARLPRLLALADVLVQPGHAGPFNDYRLPSKLPEFFAMGKPVILPAARFATDIRDGHDALVLQHGTPAEIADACQRVFSDPKLATALGRNALAYAQTHFALSANTARLAAFYASLAKTAPHARWSGIQDSDTSDLPLAADRLTELAATHPAEAAATAGDIALLTRQLETSLATAKATAASADNERADWELTRQHAANLEKSLTATQTHAANLERAQVLATEHSANLQRSLDATLQHAANLEQALRLSQQHAVNLEQARASAERALSDARQHAERVLGETREHAAHLKSALSTVSAENEKNVALLHSAETALAGARQHVASLETELPRVEAARAQARQEVADTKHLLDHAHAQIRELLHQVQTAAHRHDELVRERAAQVAALDAIIAQREDKIRRMQSTFSWQATAPLRALRRLFEKAPSAAASPVIEQPISDGPPVVASGYACALDTPSEWENLSVRQFALAGWCLREDRSAIPAIRARVDRNVFNGEVGLKRVDVGAVFPDHPHGSVSGFTIPVNVSGTGEFILEAQLPDGRWECFFHVGFSIAPDATDKPLEPYALWMKNSEDFSAPALARLRAESAAWPDRPLISVVIPTYNTPERWLKAAIESVRAQTYENWQLCIADDASPQTHVRSLLESYAKSDPRIKITLRPKNGHISAASNSALELATGDWVSLLDHDDELSPDALHHVAAAIRAHPDAGIIYSDEDKIDEAGQRYAPYFKPDFLPDLFTGQHYLTHLCTYRTALVREVGGFRVGYEGSQDWDLALRVSEKITPAQVHHIPRILYHWRAIAGSTALVITEKSYPVEAARKALRDHFARVGESVELVLQPGSHWRAQYRPPAPAPLVSLVIPTRNGLQLLQRCVDSILDKTTYPCYEILVVDNGSDDPATLAYLAQLANGTHPGLTSARTARVLRDESPFNYSALNDRAVAQARGEFVGLLNNDLEVISPDWLDEMVAQAARPGIGCVGAMLYYPDDTIQHAGVILGIGGANGVGGVAGHAFKKFPRGTDGAFNRARLAQNFSAVTAACLVVRKAIFEQVGGLDEQGLTVAFNDIDFCLKVRAAGYRNLWTPHAEFYHHESASRGHENTPEKHARFRGEIETMHARWGDALKHDPAYNPNLTLISEDFGIASRSRVSS